MAECYDFSGLAVMVIDENDFMGRVLKAVLSSMRIGNVRLCIDGRVALEELRVSVPDVLFVDHSPHQAINGLRMVRVLRRYQHPARHCPIIVTSGTADGGTVRRARNAGADYTLAKPFSVNAVHRILVALRNESREFVEVGEYYGPDRRRKQRNFAHEDRRAADA